MLFGSGKSNSTNMNFNLPDTLSLDDIKELMEFSASLELKSKAKSKLVTAAAIPTGLFIQFQAEKLGISPPFLHLLIEGIQNLTNPLGLISNVANTIYQEGGKLIDVVQNDEIIRITQAAIEENPDISPTTNSWFKTTILGRLLKGNK